MDFNNFYIPPNGKECPLQVSYLLIYLTWLRDVNTTSLSRSRHWWAGLLQARCPITPRWAGPPKHHHWNWSWSSTGQMPFLPPNKATVDVTLRPRCCPPVSHFSAYAISAICRMAHSGQTWRHTQNRKYITYCTVTCGSFGTGRELAHRVWTCMKGLACCQDSTCDRVQSSGAARRTPVCEFWRRASWSARVVTSLMPSVAHVASG